MACSISLCVGCSFSSNNFTADIMKPGVQYPHWTAPCCTKASCTGWSCPSVASPSTVMISAPCARGAGTRQAITALPSRKIVHAPHSPSAQPSLVPIKFPSSRKSRNRVLSYPFLKEYFLPLIIVSMGLDGDACNDWRLLSEISLSQHSTLSDGIPACDSLFSIDLIS